MDGGQPNPKPVVTMSLIPVILQEFLLPGDVLGVTRHGAGHINDTFRVRVRAGLEERVYLLQRLNPGVFVNAHEVMANMQLVTGHMAGALRRRGVADVERRVPQLVTTREGQAFVRDVRGGVWRLLKFIAGTRTIDHADTVEQAHQVGRVFGLFHLLMADFDGELYEVIPGFHNTPARLDALEAAAREDAVGRFGEVRREVEQVLAAREEAGELEALRARGALPSRVAHHDAKVGNVLFDEKSGEALCVVDLDTVMVGTLLYDVGDLIRSVATASAEDEPNAEQVVVRQEFVDAALRGYLSEAEGFLTPGEKAHLHLAGRVITLEQAARFLTDFLQGDNYYPVTRLTHNLDRARVQLRIWEGLGR